MLPALLRKVRRKGGWSIRQAAARAGVSKSAYHRYEQGDLPHMISTWRNLSDFVNRKGAEQ